MNPNVFEIYYLSAMESGDVYPMRLAGFLNGAIESLANEDWDDDFVVEEPDF